MKLPANGAAGLAGVLTEVILMNWMANVQSSWDSSLRRRCLEGLEIVADLSTAHSEAHRAVRSGDAAPRGIGDRLP